MSHDDSTIRGEDHDKEVVRDELQESMGLEVDGRGIEAMESQPTIDSEPVPSFWKKYRILIVVVALVCVVGAVVGGAVGGTVGKNHDEDSTNSPGTNSPSATTSSASLANPSQGGMTGTAIWQSASASMPTALSAYGEGTIDIFVQGSINQAVYSKSLRKGSWTPSISEYSYIGGVSTANIAAVSRAEGKVDLFIRGDDYAIYHTGLLEFDWQPTNGSTTGSVEAISWASDRADVFVVGFDGIVYNWIWRNSSTNASTLEGWSTWEWLGANDSLTHDWKDDSLTIVSWGRNRYDFFGVRNIDNALYHRASTGNRQWEPDFKRLGGYCTSRPAAVCPKEGEIYLFVRGGDQRIWYTSYDDSDLSWSEFAPIGTLTISGEPHAVSWGPNRVDVFACSNNGNATWHISFNGTSWTEWESLGGDSGNSPTAIAKETGSLDVFVIGNSGEVMWTSFHEGDGEWQPWLDLGVPGRA